MCVTEDVAHPAACCAISDVLVVQLATEPLQLQMLCAARCFELSQQLLAAAGCSQCFPSS